MSLNIQHNRRKPKISIRKLSLIIYTMFLISCNPDSPVGKACGDWYLLNNSSEIVYVEYGNDKAGNAITYTIYPKAEVSVCSAKKSLKEVSYIPFERLYERKALEDRIVIIRDIERNIIKQWQWKEDCEIQDAFFDESCWVKTSKKNSGHEKMTGETYYWEDITWTRTIF